MKTYKKLSDLLNSETPHGFGRSLYKGVSCGPWISYIMKNGKDVYYGDAPDKLTGCIGVKVGSIVEGSDVEIDPEELIFPFTDKDFWNKVDEVNKQASFYWERDNTDNFQILKGKKVIGFVTWTEFDDKPKWEGEVPKDIQEKWVKWYTKDRWVNDSYVIPKDHTSKFTKGWTCVQFYDEITF